MPLPVQQRPSAAKKFAVILTSSPYKLKLQLDEQEKPQK